MNLHLNFRNPTATHCDVAVFVNGALSGTLCLRQEELFALQTIVLNGADPAFDKVRVDGDPTPPRERSE